MISEGSGRYNQTTSDLQFSIFNRLYVSFSRANDDWPIDDKVMENKIAELKAKELQQNGEGSARKYQAHINYDDEIGLMVVFLKGIDDLREKLEKQQSVLLEGELNESNTEACREKIKGIETEIVELKRRFSNRKNYAITAMKSKFERSIIYDIYGAPEKVPKQGKQKDAADDENSSDNPDDDDEDDDDSDASSGSGGDDEDDEDEDGDSDDAEEAGSDDDENHNMAVGVNDEYEWADADAAKSWKKTCLLGSEFTLTRTDLGLPPVLFSPQTLQSLIVRDDFTVQATKGCFIVGVDELYECVTRLISYKVRFLSKIDTLAFLVTTRDTKSKDANKDDVKK